MKTLNDVRAWLRLVYDETRHSNTSFQDGRRYVAKELVEVCRSRDFMLDETAEALAAYDTLAQEDK